MKKAKKTSIIFLLIIFLANPIVNSLYLDKKSLQYIYVDINGCGDYTKIQDAIDNASKNAVIYVFNGVYNETILVDKTLEIIGQNSTNTIIDGKYSSIVVNIENISVKIANFTIRNSKGFFGNAGIKTNKNYTNIKNCIFYNTKSGIYVDKSSNNVVDSCYFTKNADGIFLNQSSKNIIKNCNFNHNSIGINIEGGEENQILDSYLHTNGISCHINNSKKLQLQRCNISFNSVNLGGIFLLSCIDALINNSILYHNGAGACIYSCKNLTISNCDFNDNTHFGISFRSPSKDVKIEKSQIINSQRYGIYIEKDNIIKIQECNIYNNNLQAIKIKEAFCDAKNNWWGSKFGPSLLNLKRSCKVTWIFGNTSYYPWEKEKFKDIGAAWQENKELKDIDIKIPEIRIKLEGNDTDLDGVPDWWEEKYNYDPLSWDDHINLDPDGDALNNFEECYAYNWGADPFKKDIFLEIDWMPCDNPDEYNRPSEELLEEVKNIFLEHDIHLHVDIGDMGGGTQIPYCKSKFSFSKLRDLYWDYFLENNLTNPRKGIFHYGLICSYCPDLNFPFFGWDSLDSFAISSEWLKEILPLFSRDRLIVGGAVHHLGHTLGLTADTYDGIDNMGASQFLSIDWWKYRNYKSCMSYRYKYWMFSYSDGTNGKVDYNDWANMEFDFFKNTHFEWPKE